MTVLPVVDAEVHSAELLNSRGMQVAEAFELDRDLSDKQDL